MKPGGGRWVKYAGNPVLGGEYGSCFDLSADVCGDRHRMWFSWRPKHGIGYAESSDGLHWDVREEPVLAPPAGVDPETHRVTRPYVLVEDDRLIMWYSEHSARQVVISRAVSQDGINWTRTGVVMRPERSWEKSAVMCPTVLRDDDRRYHLWYSGGDSYEPDAIGYATSLDGIRWIRVRDEPVLRPGDAWESDRVAGAHVFRVSEWLYAAYIGFANDYEDSAIGIARSRDGVAWERHAGNPVLSRGGAGEFDSINVYKPFVVVDGDEWRMWFNASSPISGGDIRHENRIEQIGYASCRFSFQPAGRVPAQSQPQG